MSIKNIKIIHWEFKINRFFRRHGVTVVLSQTENPSFIMDMFNILDEDNSGFLDVNEFGVAQTFRHQKN